MTDLPFQHSSESLYKREFLFIVEIFRESVDFVLVELRKMEAGSSDLVIDGHFMPYTRRCIPCAIDYDVIIKFESLEADSEYMIEQCHLEDVLEIKHENAAPTGPRTAQVNRPTKKDHI